MKKAKTKIKGLKQAHTSNSKIGMGDYTGTGVRNPIGRSLDIMGQKIIKQKSLKKAPKSLA